MCACFCATQQTQQTNIAGTHHALVARRREEDVKVLPVEELVVLKNNQIITGKAGYMYVSLNARSSGVDHICALLWCARMNACTGT